MPPYVVFHLLSSYDGKSPVAQEHYWLNGALQGTPDWRYKAAASWREFEAVRRKNPVADLWLIGLKVPGGYIRLNKDGYAVSGVKPPYVCLLLPDTVTDIAKEVADCNADAAIKLSSLPRQAEIPTRNRSLREVIEKLIRPTQDLPLQGPT